MRIINQPFKLELSQFGKDWDKAIEANDVHSIAQFMSDDWVIIGTDGGITNKESFLDFIRSGDLQHNSMHFEDLRIEIYDNTGIVTSRGTSSGTYKGQPFSFYEWSSNVFIRKNDKWLCVLTMLTPAKKSE
ncbi:MAG: nuclear transport factor 2 family protein [Flavisolibacter sp.]